MATEADFSVNADRANKVGKEILKSMDDRLVNEYTFKRKSTVKNMAGKVSIRYQNNEDVIIDPLLLFQRMITAGKNTGDLKNILTYELSTYPPSLFVCPHTM